MIAYCGIKCSACDAFIATQADNDAKRTEIAAKIKNDSGAEVNPADINCDGCKATSGIQIDFCNQCQIRACSASNGYETCADCEEMDVCEYLGFIHQRNIEAKNNLMEMRK